MAVVVLKTRAVCMAYMVVLKVRSVCAAYKVGGVEFETIA